MIKFIPGLETSLEGKTLFVSALSVGSVGTITLDLLIINNEFKKIAYLKTQAFQNAVGILSPAFGDNVIGLPAEFYLKGDIVILQLRSRIRKGYSSDLIKQIKKIAEDNKFKDIVFVGSLTFGYNSRPDNQISSKQNIYHFTKGTTSFKLQESNDLKTLVHQGQQIQQYLQNAGLSDQVYEQFDNVVFFLIFANPVWDPKSSLTLANYLKETLPIKQISQTISKVIEA